MTAADEFPVGGYPDGWCFHHERVHQWLTEWGDQCQGAADLDFDQRYLLFQQAWRDAERDDRDRRRRRWRWVKRVTVCWWRHRTRKVGDGTYLSTSCRACSGGG